MSEEQLLDRITVDSDVLDGKPTVRGRRLAVEHLMGMLIAGDPIPEVLVAYPWLDLADVHACLIYTGRLANERIHPFALEAGHETPARRVDFRDR
ncbi:MAG: DUF433 domain-containing protein [Chromatiales bacterium]